MEDGRPLDGDEVALLVFRVAGERFAVPARAVEVALDAPTLQLPPDGLADLVGALSYRGAVLSVAHPERALGVALDTPERPVVLVVRAAESSLVALAVDDVEDVIDLSDTMVTPVPVVGEPHAIFLGLFRHRGALVVLVDPDALHLACRAAPVPHA